MLSCGPANGRTRHVILRMMIWFWGWVAPALALVMAAIGGGILWLFWTWTWLWQALILIVSAAVVFLTARSNASNPVGRPEYALTNRRVLVIKPRRNSPPLVEERELAETAGMRLTRGRDGFGTIVFEKKTRFVWHGQSGTVETYEFSFQHVAHAEAVFDQIRAARAAYR